MSSRNHLALSWLSLPAIALVLLVLNHWADGERVARLTEQATWSVPPPLTHTNSPTGYANSLRAITAEDRSAVSLQWVMQAQLAVASSDPRVNHVTYDNAPNGRETHLPVAYRTFILLLAHAHALVFNTSPAAAAESVAYYVDPMLHIAAVLGVLALAWRYFGVAAAGLAAAISAFTFPLNHRFLAGSLDHNGAAQICAMFTLLLLTCGIRSRVRAVTGSRELQHRDDTSGLFMSSGFVAAVGISLSLNTLLPVLAGVALGAIGLMFFARSSAALAAAKLPWRIWGFTGAGTAVLLFLLQDWENLSQLRLQANNPVYSLAWIALGEMLHRLQPFISESSTPHRSRAILALSLLALASLSPAILLIATGQDGWYTSDLDASVLTHARGTISADSFLAWFESSVERVHLVLTLVPTALIVLAGHLVLSRSVSFHAKPPLIFAAAGALPVLCSAVFALRMWNTVDAVCVSTIAAGTLACAAATRLNRGMAFVVTVLVLVVGVARLVPERKPDASNFTTLEFRRLIERDFSHWLAARAPNAVVLAPPSLSSAVSYYGSLRVLATPDTDNKLGYTGAVRMMTAQTAEEAFHLAQNRTVTHIAMPTWDNFFQEYADAFHPGETSVFIRTLARWELPTWLRPIAYNTPTIEGAGDLAIVLLEVTEESEAGTHYARLGEYFLESRRPRLARQLRPFLEKFRADLSALVALANLSLVLGTDSEARRDMQAIEEALAVGLQNELAWDRRVSLAILLARAKRMEAAREELHACHSLAQEADLRSLSPRALSLYATLGSQFGLKHASQELDALTGKLLPAAAPER